MHRSPPTEQFVALNAKESKLTTPPCYTRVTAQPDVSYWLVINDGNLNLSR